MVAFLTLDVLRAHAAPVLSRTAFAADATRRPRQPLGPRPVLRARWLIAPDGQLTCRWQTDQSAPFGPPPD
jgi:hypothetical protein